jgi:hypothetical protein
MNVTDREQFADIVGQPCADLGSITTLWVITTCPAEKGAVPVRGGVIRDFVMARGPVGSRKGPGKARRGARESPGAQERPERPKKKQKRKERMKELYIGCPKRP